MDRRRFMQFASALVTGASVSVDGIAARSFPFAGHVKTLVLVALDGGNDALNTVIPLADPRYHALRPTLAIRRDEAIVLDNETGLHPSMLGMMPAWEARELAIVQGVGYANTSRSHFRAREIWHTAADAHQYCRDGWLAKAIAESGGTRACVVGSADAGPFARAGHDSLLYTGPARSFDAAARFIAARTRHDDVSIVHVTLPGFDTHEHQSARHARLLFELAEGLAALRRTLIASDDWRAALVLIHSEFGRSARENDARGTDHGAAAAQLLLGGSVQGGLYGAPPRLDEIDSSGGLPVHVDFRRLYATALRACWRSDGTAVLGRGFEPLPLMRV